LHAWTFKVFFGKNCEVPHSQFEQVLQISAFEPLFRLTSYQISKLINVFDKCITTFPLSSFPKLFYFEDWWKWGSSQVFYLFSFSLFDWILSDCEKKSFQSIKHNPLKMWSQNCLKLKVLKTGTAFPLAVNRTRIVISLYFINTCVCYHFWS